MDLRTPDPAALADLVVPVGLGALTWLAGTLAAGVLLSVDGLTPLALVVPLVLGALFLPVYRARPWEPGHAERVLGWARRRRRALAVAAAVFAVARLPVVSDLVSPALAVVLLPLRVLPQVLYGARLFYGAVLGAPAGRVLFDLGGLYLELLWLYALGVAVAKLFPADREGDAVRAGEAPGAGEEGAEP